jgi:hypothetical protein
MRLQVQVTTTVEIIDLKPVHDDFNMHNQVKDLSESAAMAVAVADSGQVGYVYGVVGSDNPPENWLTDIEWHFEPQAGLKLIATAKYNIIETEHEVYGI